MLIVFNGSPESCVMFDMIRYGLSQEKFKRLTIKPYAVYVDSTCLSGQPLEKRQKHLIEVFKFLEHFQFEMFYTSIVKDVPLTKVESGTTFLADNNLLQMEEQFVANFKSLSNLTSNEDFLVNAHSNAVRWAASQIDCKYAFVSSISHQIATNLLINVALGRGSSVANEVSFADSRNNSLAKIFRPLRNVTQLEIETYLRLNENLREEMQKYSSLNIDSNCQSGPSIQNLTRQFVNDLQENFASTVSTVFRTGDKISAAASTTQTDTKPKRTCKFCHSELDFETSTTLFAIEYSRCVSACADRNEVNDVDLMLKRAKNNVLGTNDTEIDGLLRHLCHGCRNIFRDLDKSENRLNDVKS